MDWIIRVGCVCALGALAFGYGGSASAQCADGSHDQRLTDTIYGCSGAWNVGGVVDETGAPVGPKCELRAGNTGALPTIEHMVDAGAECTAADLCAPGWSLCGAADVPADGLACSDATTADGKIYIAATDDCTVEGVPLVVGCGNVGCPSDFADGLCSVANRTSAFGLQGQDPCETLNRTACNDGGTVEARWSCFLADETDTAPGTVTKGTSLGGGVLCCLREVCDCLGEDGVCYADGDMPEPCVKCVAGGEPGVPLTEIAECSAEDAGVPDPLDAGPIDQVDAGPNVPRDLGEGEVTFRGDGGCECRTAGEGTSSLWFSLLALVLFARRRR